MEPNQEKETITQAPEATPTEVATSEPVTPTAAVDSTESSAPVLLDTPTRPFYKNSTFIASVVGAVVIFGAGAFAYVTYYAHGGTVAVVNGTRIYRDEFEQNVTLITQGALAQGEDVTTETVQSQIRTQALDILINNLLITNAARESGITVTDEAVQAKYDEVVAELGSEEELKKRIAEIGLTEEKLRSNIIDRILADEYIQSKMTVKDLAVTEEEVTAFIDGLGTGVGQLPPLEEIRPQIEAQILSQKQQAFVTNIIEELKKKGDVEVKI
jgi:peptidyl-prolyl cis-trans isomerase SurA